jgi:flagellar hook-associated protein 1 FlgK
MSSTFGGIAQAASSLAASQYGLQIVSQNIANAGTPGYTRQEVDLTAADPVQGVPRRYVTGGDPGGVHVSGTQRLNDPVLDARSRTEHARSGAADTAASQLSQIEDIFPEPSDTGLGEQLSTFWKDWANVANSPDSSAARTVLLQDGGTVADTLRSMSTSLEDVKASTAQALRSDIDKANTAAKSLSALNNQIAIGTATGENVNSLLDQRDQLLGRLSSLVGAKATISDNGTAEVTVSGQALVGTDGSVNPVTVDASNRISVGGTAVTLDGGSAAASITTLTSTLPTVKGELDGVAAKLAGAVNAVQANGVDLSGAPGAPMFNDGSGAVTAATIHVSMTDPSQVAAGAAGSGKSYDGSNALDASELGSAPDSPDAAYADLVGDVGSASSLAQSQQATQDSVTSSVDARRQAASGVSLDEEVSNMLTLQHTYQAASRVLTTMDSLLDTLINHTGVGA